MLRRLRKRNSRLNIEQLERRACPAVTILDLGDSLKIVGDADNDLIEIVDQGGGALHVNGTDFFGIHRVEIDAKGGADEVHYQTAGELSVSEIRLKLGSGDDIAKLNLGAVRGELQSEIEGGAGADAISVKFDAVFAGADARSLVDGGLGDDLIGCEQNNIAGRVSCISRGGLGNDAVFCEKNNVMEGGLAECISDGGLGDDAIGCIALDVAGHSSCVSDGGLGHDLVSCKITNLAETGSALCHQTGGDGNDEMTCDKDTVHGAHVCFGDGGSGDDVMNWVSTGENSGDFQCTMHGGAGDDKMNIFVGVDQEGNVDPEGNLFTGTVEYFAGAGVGNDTWSATVNFRQGTTGVFQSLTVLLGSGDDTLILAFLSPVVAQVSEHQFSGGLGEDAWIGPPPSALGFTNVEDFEIGV
jgi:hypothetical protein